jgi:hypothetical protein
MIRVILDEHDTDTLLRTLYKGMRPLLVHTLICACGAIGDLRVSAAAWDGWQVFPHAKCPACLALGHLPNPPMPTRARESFLKLVEELCVRKEG